MSTWKFDFTGRIEKLRRGGQSKDMIIEEQLTKVENDFNAQRYALVLARRLDSGRRVLLKIRYDLNPRGFDIDDLQENRELCDDEYLGELETVKIVNSINHGPALLDWYTKRQSEDMPYPQKGIMDVYIMDLVPGENVDDIFEDLEWEHLRIIRAQLTYILETLRIQGRILDEQHPRFLNYNKKAKKLYFFDFSFCSEIPLDELDMYDPITQYDDWVLAFNIWPDEMLRSEPRELLLLKVPQISQRQINMECKEWDCLYLRQYLLHICHCRREHFQREVSRIRDRDENRPPQWHPGYFGKVSQTWGLMMAMTRKSQNTSINNNIDA
ncbi:uncharacterized protein TRUGW13939_01941 [Talaromyces rugulosus]|uniref:Protein kinase domain-containing protein n=1 Tax=Talaromyces rugulosus TaxID=121627 RepID=A0A7H8QM18_TALRU|nr:uncharacterized protein TRUGW13939_01941 [Talaromyces rugulosus]QKX54852.1 hypothetical protein TRUGW13939_01941 [Talaromyces rugulosus]